MRAGPSRALFAAAAFASSSLVSAVHFDVLGKRSHVSGLTDGNNVKYSANITLNGAPFSVLIDTGSSDLWVAGTVPNAADTGASASITYAIGSAEGSIKKASLDLLGYTIQNQAFIEVSPSSSNPQGEGIIGLGPNAVSEVYQALGKTTGGSAPVFNIFRQNTSSPNFVTVLLGRSDDPDAQDQVPGEITIGEVVAGRESITSQPKVNVTYASNQHWQTLLDADGVLGPDGAPLNLTTAVTGTKNKKQLTAVFDTGFSLTQVPQAMARSIYGRFEGATFTNVSGIGSIWVLPCEYEVNVTIVMAGQKYLMHPLDTNMDVQLGKKDSSNRDLCIGSLQPISTAKSTSYDIILGMSWLRNAYLLINYGDFTGDEKSSRTTPYVQALSLTDPAEAHGDFVQVRLGGIDSTGGQHLLATPASPNTTDVDNGDDGSWFSRHWVIIAIAGGSAAGGLLLITLGFCFFRRRKQNVKYQTLAAPAPQPAGAMSYVAGYASRPSMGQRPNTALGAPASTHSRELSDTSTLLEAGEYDAYKHDPHKAGAYNYPNPWDKPYGEQ